LENHKTRLRASKNSVCERKRCCGMCGGLTTRKNHGCNRHYCENSKQNKETGHLRGQNIKKPIFLIYCFTYNLIKLVSFKVLPSTLDTPLPTFFPVLERVLERVLRDGAKVPYRIFFYFLYRPKSANF